MKNIIKKITSVAFAMFAVLGMTTTAFASDAQWNNYPGDLSFIQSKIFVDASNPGNYQANTYNAQPGQTIAVRLYYHNTGTGPATNTTFRMTQPSGKSTTHVISGTLSADGTNTDSGSTTISLTSAQTLTYVPGSLRFYRYNQYSTATPVGGDGSQIFSGGLNVGTIPGMETCPPTNDFCEQGVVAVAFRVGNETVQPTVYACNDGIDNDGDGKIDYPYDAGCSSYTDNDEYNYVPPTVSYVCSNGIDDDGDGRVDSADPGCYVNGVYDPYDNTEYNYVAPTQTLVVTTLSPSNLTSSSGQLNGSVVNSGLSTTIYFEWGTSETNLANRTVSQSTSVNGGASFFDTLRGLQTNTTYYYRAVGQNSTSTSRGEIKSFRLVSGSTTVPTTPTVITTPVRTVTQVVTTPAPTVASATEDRGVVLGLGTNLVQLRYVNANSFTSTTGANGGFGQVSQINNGVQNVCVDETATFTVEYRNISNVVLANAILHIDIPKDVDFRSSSAGVYNKSDNTITVNVGTLNPDQAGQVTFSGVVLESASNRDLLVVPATLSFENPNNGARETAIAYGLATTQNCLKTSNLSGFAFGSGFFPSTLIGWLILILVLLALAYLIRRWVFLTPVRRSRVQKYYEDMDVPTAPYKH